VPRDNGPMAGWLPQRSPSIWFGGAIPPPKSFPKVGVITPRDFPWLGDFFLGVLESESAYKRKLSSWFQSAIRRTGPPLCSRNHCRSDFGPASLLGGNVECLLPGGPFNPGRFRIEGKRWAAGADWLEKARGFLNPGTKLGPIADRNGGCWRSLVGGFAVAACAKKMLRH